LNITNNYYYEIYLILTKSLRKILVLNAISIDNIVCLESLLNAPGLAKVFSATLLRRKACQGSIP